LLLVQHLVRQTGFGQLALHVSYLGPDRRMQSHLIYLLIDGIGREEAIDIDILFLTVSAYQLLLRALPKCGADS
jgi:hypothetical protein